MSSLRRSSLTSSTDKAEEGGEQWISYGPDKAASQRVKDMYRLSLLYKHTLPAHISHGAHLDRSNVTGHVKKNTSLSSIIDFNDDYIVFLYQNSTFGSLGLVENCLLYTTKKVIRVVEGEVKQTVPYEQVTEVSQESRGLFSFNRVTVLCDEKTIKLSVWNRDVSVWTVKLLEGFIAQNLQRSKEQKVEEDNVPFNTADEAPPDGLPTPDLNRQYSEKTALRHRLAAAEEEIEDGKQCRICLDHQMDCILTPCAHLVCCTTCAASLNDKECPVCRTIVSGNTKIFWA